LQFESLISFYYLFKH